MEQPAVDFEARVLRAMATLLPAMVADGGGAEVVSVTQGEVSIRLIGSCLFCPSRPMSAEALKRNLRRLLPDLGMIHVEYPSFEDECIPEERTHLISPTNVR